MSVRKRADEFESTGGQTASHILIYFLVFISMTIFVALLFRNSGVYPVVADEDNYNKFSRLVPLADAEVPSFIYFGIYRSTNLCGDGFLSCVRLFNAAFFVAAAPFIYLTARLVCAGPLALLVALLALLGPVNSYTAYFMPEASYFFFFWLATWFALRQNRASGLLAWCIGGVLLSLSALIKPHALLIIPGFAVYIFMLGRRKNSGWMLAALGNGVAFVGSALIGKFAVSYLIAGKAGLTFFGSLYGGLAARATTAVEYVHLAALSAKSLAGHLLGICLLFGMPVALGLYTSAFSLCDDELTPQRKLSLFTLLVFGNLVAVTAIFTASLANMLGTEEIVRLHARYYDFAFPLLYMIAGSQLAPYSMRGGRVWRMLWALPVGGVALYAVYTQLVPFLPNFVDSPEFRGFIANPKIYYLLSALSLLSLALWAFTARLGAGVFTYFFLPLAVLLTNLDVNRELRLRLIASPYENGAIFAHEYLSQDDRKRLVIAGSHTGELHLASVLLDTLQVVLLPVAENAAFDLSQMPPGKEWLLLVGDHPLSEDIACQIRGNGFVLARLGSTDTVDFRKSVWPCVVSRIQGLYPAEPGWGTWSASDVVTLEFVRPLPQHFKLHLIAHAYASIIGQEVVARVGDSAIRFTLAASNEEKILEFNNPKRSKVITFDIPLPVSLKERRASGDERRLGVGFVVLRIQPE
jgi:phosphoglycerol transferase